MSLLIVILVIVMVLAVYTSTHKGTADETSPKNAKKTKHADDLTCEAKYNHKHDALPTDTPRYIVQEEPEEGYIVLNGKKIRKQDCKNL